MKNFQNIIEVNLYIKNFIEICLVFNNENFKIETFNNKDSNTTIEKLRIFNDLKIKKNNIRIYKPNKILEIDEIIIATIVSQVFLNR